MLDNRLGERSAPFIANKIRLPRWRMVLRRSAAQPGDPILCRRVAAHQVAKGGPLEETTKHLRKRRNPNLMDLIAELH